MVRAAPESGASMVPVAPRQPKGRPPKTLIVDGPWESAVDRALARQRPAGGWPNHDRDTRRAKRRKATARAK